MRTVTQRPNHDPGAVRPPDFVFADLQQQIKAIYDRQDALYERLLDIEDKLDCLGSPWWKRLLFWIDGWGTWYKLRDGKRGRPNGPAWRPWRKWWTS